MVRGGVRKLACGVRRAGLLAAAAALAVGAAACTTTGSGTTASIAPAGATIAFESIDGPPPAVFRRLVQKLGDEAEARHLPLVSREGFAPYRVRGYLAAATERKARRTLISWVWDVYDAQQSRALRISGEEAVSGAPADAWSAVDDALIARIAQKGMGQLADYLSRGGAQPEPAAPGREPDAATPVAAAGDPKLALAE
jgi:hypothetical protein